MPIRIPQEVAEKKTRERFCCIYTLIVCLFLAVSSLVDFPRDWGRILYSFLLPLSVAGVSLWQLSAMRKR